MTDDMMSLRALVENAPIPICCARWRRGYREAANSSFFEIGPPTFFCVGMHRPGGDDRLVGHLLAAGEILDRIGRTSKPAVDCCVAALARI